MALTKVKAGNIILTTPSANSNDVTPATTQYVTTALANLADSAPSTLNTLNELAAALGDDANFSTTVTNSIATKLPLAGGTLTGGLSIRGFNGPVLKIGSSGSADPRIDFEDQNSTSLGAGIFLDQDQDTLRILRTVSGSATDGIAIDASGNVGIGASSISSWTKLQVAGTAGAQDGAKQALYIQSPTTTVNEGVGIRMSAASGSHEAVGIIGMVNNASGNAGAMTFHTYNLGATIPEVMRLDNNGAVLVGSTTNLNVLSGSPMLQIGAGSGHSSLQFYSATGSVGALYFGDATSGADRYDGYLEYRHNSRDMAFRAGGATVLTLKGNNANGTGHNVDYGEHQHDVGEGVGVGEFYTQVAGSSFTDQFRINFDNASWGGVTVDIRLNPNSSAGASVWVQYTIYSHAAHASANISAKDISGEGTGYINWVQESAGNLKCQLKTQYVTDDASARITYQMNHRGSQSIYLEEI